MPFLFGPSYPDFFYSSLKSGLITSTDVTDREENKRETSKDKRSAHRREVHVVILKFRKTQTLRSASMYSQRTTDGNVKKKKRQPRSKVRGLFVENLSNQRANIFFRGQFRKKIDSRLFSCFQEITDKIRV